MSWTSLIKTNSSTYFSRIKNVWVLLLFISLFLGFCWPRMSESFWFDEVFNTKYYLGQWETFGQILSFPVNMPLTWIFLYGWIHIAGDSEISVRIPFLISGILSIALIYLIARTWSGKKTALLTLISMSFSPVLIWYSTESRVYVIGVFLTLSACYCLLKIQTEIHPRMWYGMYFISSFMSCMNHLFASVICAMIAFFFCFKKNGKTIVALNLAILFFVFAFLACRHLILLNSSQSGYASAQTFFTWWALLFNSLNPAHLGYLRPFTYFEWWMLFFNWYLCGNTLIPIFPYGARWSMVVSHPFLLWSQIAFCLILLKGIWRVLAGKPDNTRWIRITPLIFLIAIPMMLVVVRWLGVDRSYIERSTIFGLPFFYLFLALGIRSIRHTWIRRISIAYMILFSFFSAVFLFRSGEQRTVHHPKPDWRSAVRYLREDGQASKGNWLILFSRPDADFAYYAQGLPLTRWKSVEVLTQKKVRVFYFVEDIWWIGQAEQIIDLLQKDPRFKKIDERSFKSLRIYKFLS